MGGDMQRQRMLRGMFKGGGIIERYTCIDAFERYGYEEKDIRETYWRETRG